MIALIIVVIVSACVVAGVLCLGACAMSSLCSRAEERRERECQEMSDKFGIW